MIDEIIEYTILNDYAELSVQVSGVKFKKNFGYWKQGDYAAVLNFDFEKGLITEYTCHGSVFKECPITLVPKC